RGRPLLRRLPAADPVEPPLEELDQPEVGHHYQHQHREECRWQRTDAKITTEWSDHHDEPGHEAPDGAIARKGVPAPLQAGWRLVVERTHRWMNGYGKLRRRTEQLQMVVDFDLFLTTALVVLRQRIQRARPRYR